MTILLTKPSEKKKDILVIPLVDDEKNPALDPSTAPPPPYDAESQSSRNVVILRTKTKRVSSSVTLCLMLTALSVVGIGIVAGVCVYNQFVRAEMQRYMDFRGRATIPYDDSQAQAMFLQKDFDDEDFFNHLRNNMNHFSEDFELDLDNENYEKITVPDFKYGRNGRFIHDFNTNITGIVDITGGRCFIMPLNRDKILPPKSLFDLIYKMWDGYYKVDTQRVRESMRVVLPPIKDLKSVGNYIGKECENKPVYKLEKYVSGVVKRSADQAETSFAQFAGKGILEFDIVNFQEVEQYEREHLK